MTNVRGEKRQRGDVVGDAEFNAMLARAAEDRPHPYYALRDPAILCVFWKTGKRREEVASLELDDLRVDRSAGLLEITFTVLKKRKGTRLAVRRTKSISLDDPYVQPILNYLEYMKREHPECRYLFPTTKLTGFGNQRTLYVDPDRHLTGRQLWNVVTEAGPETWPHLFRETQGAKVARRYGNTITGAFAVKQRLDLERIETAMRYVARYAIDLIEAEVHCEIS